MTLAFRRVTHRIDVAATTPVHDYLVRVEGDPMDAWTEIRGPGYGIRIERDGSHDFSCFTSLVRTLVTPEMTDLEKAMAVYRFITTHTHGASIGFGNTESTRFLNCYGYSFCWGQADFQHLLYESAGLRCRAPLLPGHSSVEVFIDGRWRAIDAFMRLLLPSPTLDGIATGDELAANPPLIDASRSGPMAVNARLFWATHAPGGTYEPWQDSRAMLLALRRGESLRVASRGWGDWCLSPEEPPNYANGRWSWKPPLDDKFLAGECESYDNVRAAGGVIEPLRHDVPGEIEFVIDSPYPLSRGKIVLGVAARVNASLMISTDQRKTWRPISAIAGEPNVFDLTSRLSLKGRPPEDDIAGHEVRKALVRVRWLGGPLTGIDFEGSVQLNARAWPALTRGVNRWTAISGGSDVAVSHGWDEHTGLHVSDVRPFEGDEVTLKAVVHNIGQQPSTPQRVRLTQAGAGIPLAETTVAPIEPGKSRSITLTWRAAIHGDRGDPSTRQFLRYLHTRLRLELEQGENRGEWSSVAEAIVIVRPRPVPRVHSGLIHVERVLPLGENKLQVRAAVIHSLDPEGVLLYLPDSELDACVTLYLGHPDRGGLPLTEAVSLRGIKPSEFAVAQWRINTAALPKRFELWVESLSPSPVAAEHQRVLAGREVVIE